ncbi:MAG: hypothetical protein WCR01_09605 [Bacteroidota bacterium]
MLFKRLAFRKIDFPNLIYFRSASILFAGFLFLSFPVWGSTFRFPGSHHDEPSTDTIIIRKGRYILSKNTSIYIPRDTFYVVSHRVKNMVEASAYQHSKVFYDTMYKKFSRKKITKILYYLAFVEPKQSDLPDTLQVLKSVTPFEEFRGKIIRNISIKVLPPFGSNVYDTSRLAVTGIGKALNSVHMNTRKYVIRRNLLFKPGDSLNPSLFADNERLLRNLTAIDNARIIVSKTSPQSDSVDLVIVAKDVWSIGVDVPLVTPQQVRVRLFDANFLGLGDQLTNSMSLDLYRASFYLFEGVAYTYTNIGSSLINATVSYMANPAGDRSFLLRFDRAFLTNQTKWAGGAFAAYEKAVTETSNEATVVSFFNDESLWVGRAFLLKRQKETSRAIVSVGINRRDYGSRPVVTIDSNRSYYNRLQFLSSFSLSRNNYYLTDYILDFGKTENLPYGHLFQITVGTEQSDFYTRLYSGVHISLGNFFQKIGYIAGYMKFGGYFNHSSFEDAVIKFNLHYFTPLMKTRDKRFKFRLFYSADYRYAFNMRSNNSDYYDANMDFEIDKVGNEDYFKGVNIITGKLGSVCFTPWYFYGFRFAMMMELQSGLVAQKGEYIFNEPLFSSIGLSFIIKNDNLVFPAFIISAYFYPSTAENFRQVQFMLNSNLNANYYDFNVNAPHAETLGN